MEVLSVREYRNNLAASFDRAAQGKKVLIRRKNTLYALVSVGEEHVELTPEQQRQADEMTASIRRSLKEAKEMAAGIKPKNSIKSLLDEL